MQEKGKWIIRLNADSLAMIAFVIYFSVDFFNKNFWAYWLWRPWNCFYKFSYLFFPHFVIIEKIEKTL